MPPEPGERVLDAGVLEPTDPPDGTYERWRSFLCRVVSGEAAPRGGEGGNATLVDTMWLRLVSRRAGERAATRLGVPPERCLYIGDNPVNDVAGATVAGIHAIWLENDLPWPNDCRARRTRCAHFGGLLRLLEFHSRRSASTG